MIYLMALLIGVVAGSRAMMAPAIVAWGARLGWLDLSATPLAFMGNAWVPWLFGVLALAELVTDQLPATPSRKVPMQFGARLVTGALSGAAVGAAGGMLAAGLVAGLIGAAIGTYGGAALRSRLAAAFGSDRPAALIEDVLAIAGGLVAVGAIL